MRFRINLFTRRYIGIQETFLLATILVWSSWFSNFAFAQLPCPVTVRLKSALSEKEVDRRLGELFAIGKSLNLADVPVALEQAKKLGELRERVALSEAIYERWGDLAPSAVFDRIANWPETVSKLRVLHSVTEAYARKNVHAASVAVVNLPAGRARNDAVETVAQSWGENDPRAALQWVLRLPGEGFPVDRATRKIYLAWIRADPASAAQAVLTYPVGEYKSALLKNVASSWAARDPLAAVTWAQDLPEGLERELAAVAAAETWANFGPEDAANFAVKLVPLRLKDRAVVAVLGRWAEQDPQKALQWARHLQEQQLRAEGVKQILDSWTPVAPEAALSWVQGLPEGPLREMAISSFVEAVKTWDPAAGANLALQSSNKSARVLQVEHCLQWWLLWDPASAKHWLDRTDFPAELKQRWISQLPRQDS